MRTIGGKGRKSHWLWKENDHFSTKHLWMEELQWGKTNVLITYGHPETEKGSKEEMKEEN